MRVSLKRAEYSLKHAAVLAPVAVSSVICIALLIYSPSRFSVAASQTTALSLVHNTLTVVTGSSDNLIVTLNPLQRTQPVETADIEIQPPNPTTNDNISIKISGVWPNSCIPQNPEVTRVGNDIRIATSNQVQVCLAVLTNWSHTLNVGQLRAGDYQVIVIHSTPSGRSELGRKSFTVTAPIISRIVRVANTTANPGGSVRVPITLDSQGNENALSLSLSFDTSILSNPEVALGSGASTALLTVNPNQLNQGRIGILLALPAGQSFAEGTRQIVVVTFAVTANTTTNETTISPSDQPLLCQASDVNANSLPVSCLSGVVTLVRGLEADVAPRPSGNGGLSISDCVQAGRFAAGLDTPATGPGSEFQRADCAPRDSSGDGRLGITDWVQACRYAAALDLEQAVGGPTGPTSTPSAVAARARPAEGNAGSTEARTVRAINISAGSDEVGTLSVMLDAQGNENALGLSFRFDPTTWRYVSAVAGVDAANSTLNINENEAVRGHIGLALSLPTGQAFAAGTRELVRVKLEPILRVNESPLAMAFDDYPVARELSDVYANELSTRYAGLGTLRTVKVVSAADFKESTMASGSIATAFGFDLAGGSQAATMLPLPTRLAGTTVKVLDAIGRERLAPLFFVSQTQINYQVPLGTAIGPATIIISGDDGDVALGMMQITDVAPGLFTADASGKGVAAAIVLRIKADGTDWFEPAVRFDLEQNRFVPVPIDLGDESDRVYLILFGTGWHARSSIEAVSVKIGGIVAPVLYAGAQGEFAGLDQLNIGLPRSLEGRGEIELVLTVNGQTANTVRVSIR